MAAVSTHPYLSSDPDGPLHREDLVLKNLPQVRYIAKRIHDRLPSHISLEDLISTGVIGLIEAIDNYDPSLNVQLNTFAERRIRGAILDSLRGLDWTPRDTRKRARMIQAAIHKSKQRLGREPSDEEIAAELQISASDYQEWLTSIQAADLQPLDFVTQSGHETSFLQFVGDAQEHWPSTLLERSELERLLALAIDRMPKLERTILSLYYYEELSLNEISKVVGLHLSRIGQLRVQGILRLQSHMRRVWPTHSRNTP